MARYDYRCPSCHHVFEVEHGMNEKPKVTCPRCGAEASRVFEATGITLKGSGFYNTDMRDGSKGTSTTSAPSDAAASEDKGPAVEGSGSGDGAAKASSDEGSTSSEGSSAKDGSRGTA